MIEYKKVITCLIDTVQMWRKIYEEGGHDPHYTDGYLLNSCRKKILGYKQYLSAAYTEEEGLLPEEFFEETPPEVPEEYMARKKEIWVHALESYQSYLQNEDYQYLISILDSLDEDIRKTSSIDSVIRYVTNLHDSFVERNFVYLRIHETGDFVESFSVCRRKIEEMKREKEKVIQKGMETDGQMSLFGNGIFPEKSR